MKIIPQVTIKHDCVLLAPNVEADIPKEAAEALVQQGLAVKPAASAGSKSRQSKAVKDSAEPADAETAGDDS